MTRTATQAAPLPVFALQSASGLRAGEDRFRLLEAIDRLGSISAAAREVGLSYKAAWDATNTLNNLFAKPLVRARPGGRHGGGAEVTAAGRHALEAHRKLTRSLTRVLAEMSASLAAGAPGEDFPEISPWSFLMKTSARNCFHGTITAVTEGAVSTEVALQISDDTALTVVMTNQSARDLQLHADQTAFALIKASTPILILENESARLSARNALQGSVLSVEPGAVNTEVILDIGGGKTLAVIITNDSAETLALAPGVACSALIKASQIILGVD